MRTETNAYRRSEAVSPDQRRTAGGSEAVARPAACPFCQSNRVDTTAKALTVTTLWRCRECEETWTIASRAAWAKRPTSAF